MEDGWILLAEASALSGLSTKTVHYRAGAYGLALRKEWVGDTANPYRVLMREGDVPLLARKPRSAYKPTVLPSPPAGMVALSQIAAEHGVNARTLRGRIHARKVPHSRIDHRFIVAQADMPRLLTQLPHARRGTNLIRMAEGAGVPTDSESVVQFIAAQFHIDAATIYGMGRAGHVVEARHTAIAVLHRRGMYPAQLGRHFGRDHATICYVIDKVKADPKRDAFVQELVGVAATGNPSTDFDALLEDTLLDTRMSIIAAIRAYLRGSLLGWEKHDPMQMASGMAHLAADDGVRKAVATVLTRLDLSQHIGRMESHIAASGYRRAS